MLRIHTDILPKLLEQQEELFAHLTANNNGQKHKTLLLKRFQALTEMVCTWREDKIYIGVYVLEAICLAAHFHIQAIDPQNSSQEKALLGELDKSLTHFEGLMGRTFRLVP